jgi:DNA-binding response OmpR family regulator
MSPERYTILIASDGHAIGGKLAEFLKSAEYDFQSAHRLEDVIGLQTVEAFSLVLMTFGEDYRGLEICAQLRSASPQSRIMLFQPDAVPEDESRALDAGADDFLPAPFGFREIVARINALLGHPRARNNPQISTVQAADLILDAERRIVRHSAQEVPLSRRECELLRVFMQNPGIPLTRLRLSRALFGETSRDPRSIRSCVNSLRKKLGRTSGAAHYIFTVPWVGYRFRDDNGSRP